jgi:hypothetical protein
LGTPTAFGSTLGIGDGAATGLGSANTNQINTSATASTVLTGSGATPACTDPNNCATASYSVSNQFGRISLAFSTSALCTVPLCGPSVGGYNYAEASFNGSTNYGIDGIQIGTVPGGSGLLELGYLMRGTIGGGGAPAGDLYGYLDAFIGDNTNPNTVGFSVELAQPPALPNAGPLLPSVVQLAPLANGSTLFSSITPDPNLANTWDYAVYGTMVIPVSSNSSDALIMDVVGTSNDYAGPAYHPSMWFSASDDPSIGGAQVYDSTGTSLLSGVTITSTSGFDYTQPLADSVPEPATFGLIAVGLVPLAMRLRKRLRHSCARG